LLLSSLVKRPLLTAASQTHPIIPDTRDRALEQKLSSCLLYVKLEMEVEEVQQLRKVTEQVVVLEVAVSLAYLSSKL